jgi:hypothetical protein
MRLSFTIHVDLSQNFEHNFYYVTLSHIHITPRYSLLGSHTQVLL